MKTTQVLKTIFTGVIAGAAIFFVPFPFRFLFIFFLLFFVFRFFTWGRWRGYYSSRGYSDNLFWNPSYTQRWKSMSDDERRAFIAKMEAELFATKQQAE